MDVMRLAKGTTPWRYRAEYVKSRGMQVKTDVHDWLGGYPYESASPTEVRAFLHGLDFTERSSFVRSEHSTPWQPFGSGCDEYRFARLPVGN
jgi:2-polyprenyl-6-hydroxyphenyl methylase/3-demethylubiquinone-9 3-methyltransferase